jgi:CBS domain containing-hemolysin-like protein
MKEHPSLVVTLFYILVSLTLVALNGFFVAAEFAIVKVRRTRLQELEGKGVATARISLLMVEELDEYLSATQLGITLVSLGLGWVGEESFYNLFYLVMPDLAKANPTQFHGVALAISFLLITMLHVVLGELVPKSMAIQRAEKITLLITRPLQFFYKLAKPLIHSFTVLANFILHLFGFHRAEEEALSEEELKMVVQDSHEEGVISESEAQIIKQAFEFSDKRARDIMIPEHQVQCLALDHTIDENLAVAQKRMYTRFPLVRGGFQNILGVVHMKDAFFIMTEKPDNEAFLKASRAPVFVDPGMRQDQIMRCLNSKRTHLAIVRDPLTKENVGIVTLEDILEDLVGEIVDEHGN